MSRQSRSDARYWMLGAGALGRPRGMVQGGRREAGSGWGTRVYLWRIHVDIWQNQYNIVKLKNKIKIKKIRKIIILKSNHFTLTYLYDLLGKRYQPTNDIDSAFIIPQRAIDILSEDSSSLIGR